ncbi:30254_t:CDS:1 [Gigaspora margarita]|uniref:30254_t:CDS:1 n=1 Tax=Gigaspora margarita TaxID=4874 RepID=A0ABN7WRF8_GIGMA|nr:30254_t:CDS:1 [Gigaspora margarita]
MNIDIPFLSKLNPLNYTLGFDFIYVINLERRVDRREKMEALEKYHGLCFKYVKAVDKDDEIAISRLNRSKLLEPLPGMKACYLSHYNIYQSIIENGYKNALILEDDIDIELNIFDIMYNIHHNLPNDWELLYFGHCHEWMDSITLISNLSNSSDNKLYTAVYPQCTHAYAITASAAKKLLEILDIDHTSMDLAIDIELATLILAKNLTAYAVHPQIIAQWKGLYDQSDLSPGWTDDTYYLKNSTLESLGFQRN